MILVYYWVSGYPNRIGTTLFSSVSNSKKKKTTNERSFLNDSDHFVQYIEPDQAIRSFANDTPLLVTTWILGGWWLVTGE